MVYEDAHIVVSHLCSLYVRACLLSTSHTKTSRIIITERDSKLYNAKLSKECRRIWRRRWWGRRTSSSRWWRWRRCGTTTMSMASKKTENVLSSCLNGFLCEENIVSGTWIVQCTCHIVSSCSSFLHSYTIYADQNDRILRKHTN